MMKIGQKGRIQNLNVELQLLSDELLFYAEQIAAARGEQISVRCYPGSRDRGGRMQRVPAEVESVVVTSSTVFIAAPPPKGSLWGQRDALWMITGEQRNNKSKEKTYFSLTPPLPPREAGGGVFTK